ncbi:DUF983 domain-containing protein [Hoeflea ulvae]|uniref:DUF983 domain-containing protein n=1 Tax=Hoeflea ulvae TaxID=2983764 RepID=A0ABT3YFI5_9HYPH|nr:DUF983 domain-containing protein [Hoeflea ulvae]MCY0094658.1 DUF983 domain-containing protein [Hoeflea ulvae]
MLELGGNNTPNPAQAEPRSTWSAIKRGLLGRCPHCGEGKLFRAYLKPVDACAACGEEMSHHRADDFPAYLAIFVVGHIVVAGFMATDTWLVLESWQHLLIWIPITILLTLVLLQPLKGGVIGLQWALRMHGFSGEAEEPMLAEPAHEDAR